MFGPQVCKLRISSKWLLLDFHIIFLLSSPVHMDMLVSNAIWLKIVPISLQLI